MIDSIAMVERFKKAANISTDKNVAKLLGLSQQDFASRKQRGTIIVPLIEQALIYNINIHWLITGDTDIELNDSVDNRISTQELMIAIADAVDEVLEDLNIKLPKKNRYKLIIGLHAHYLEQLYEEQKGTNIISMEEYIRRNKAEIKTYLTIQSKVS